MYKQIKVRILTTMGIEFVVRLDDVLEVEVL
jgi:hypothetical protein